MRKVLSSAVIFLGLAAVPAVADNVTYTIDAHILASGSSVQAVSSCFHMNAVIGEPIAGYSWSTDDTLKLSAGFFAVAAPISDDIFFSGFEDCTP